MYQSYFKNSGGFLTRKVSADKAVKMLKRNGIYVDEEKAEVILDFLYLIAKTYTAAGVCNNLVDLQPKGDLEHLNQP
jgi:hypothetical protein